MELINATNMLAGYTMGMEPSGRELLVVVVKGTFHLPKSGEEPRLLEQQVALIMADTFTGEPGFSAPYYEVDFAPRKLKCDILLQGSAYAPEGRPISRVPVGLRIGQWQKSFAVCGKRHWEYGLAGVNATEPEPFSIQPFSYDVAFGGVDNFPEDQAKHAAFMRNPIGKGFHKNIKKEWIDGAPMPHTEALDQQVENPDGDYAPMAFGPIGRGWSSRLPHAGTYDQNWIDNTFPFLPSDFKDEYYQAAPLDQQVPYLRGGEEVVLVNLTPEGRTSFRLPIIDMPVVFFRKKGDRHETEALLDTIVIEPDKRLFSITWRVCLPLKKNIFEIPQVLVGKKSRAWWRARELGKTYYPSLEHLALSKRVETEDE